MINDILQISPEKETEITNWLCDEIAVATQERAVMEARWAEWKKGYAARPKQVRKNFPWPNASNVVYPLEAIHTDNLFARLYNTALRPNIGTVFSAQPLAKDWLHHCRAIEDFLDYVSEVELVLPVVSLDWMLEAVKFGTGLTKLLWDNQYQKKVFHEGGEAKWKLVQNARPILYHLKLQDVFVPSDATDVQSARWIDHRYMTNDMSLKARARDAKSGWKNIDKVITYLDKTDDITQQMDDAEGINQHLPKGFWLHEVWFRYDVDGDGYPESLVFTIHPETRTCVRPGINGYHHQEYPFHRLRFFPSEKRFYGIGVCGMVDVLQESVTTTLNQLHDNMTVANTRVWKGRRGSGIKAGERIYPSKMMMLEDPANDLKGEQMGDIYPSGPLILNLIKSIAEQRTGVNDYYQGRESSIAGSAATATSTLALIRQTNLKTDLTLTDFGMGLAGVATQTLQLYQQYYPAGKAYVVLGERGEIVEEMFNIPQEHIAEKVRISLSASTVSTNRDVEKQYMMQLIPVVNQFYQQLVQAVTAAISPQAPPGAKELIRRVVEGGMGLMERLVELFIPDPETVIPSMAEIDQFLNAAPPMPPPGMNPMQPATGGAPNAPVTVGGEGLPPEVGLPPGLEGLPPGA